MSENLISEVLKDTKCVYDQLMIFNPGEAEDFCRYLRINKVKHTKQVNADQNIEVILPNMESYTLFNTLVDFGMHKQAEYYSEVSRNLTDNIRKYSIKAFIAGLLSGTLLITLIHVLKWL